MRCPSCGGENHQGAKFCEECGTPFEARQMLTDIYGWFTEGFDTKDLQEAKALLDALSQES